MVVKELKASVKTAKELNDVNQLTASIVSHDILF